MNTKKKITPDSRVTQAAEKDAFKISATYCIKMVVVDIFFNKAAPGKFECKLLTIEVNIIHPTCEKKGKIYEVCFIENIHNLNPYIH